MIESKFSAIAFYVIIVSMFSCSRQVGYTLENMSPATRAGALSAAIDMSREIILQQCAYDPNPEKTLVGGTRRRKQYREYDVDSLAIIPILLFKVSDKAEEYEGFGLTGFLELEEQDLIGFYVFHDRNFEGLLDWSGEHHFNIERECAYYTVSSSKSVEQNPYWKGYKYLVEQGRDVEFLFSVKYFIETLWFVEDNLVFMLDLRSMSVFDPDTFVQTKCYKGFIGDVARGGQVGCNH